MVKGKTIYMNSVGEELSVLQQTYREHPEDKAAALSLAQHYCDVGWFNEAVEIYQTLLDREPGDVNLLLEYGNTVFKKSDMKAAAQLFAKLTELRPERIEGWNNLGIARTRLDDMEGSCEAFSRVLELEPENSGALLNMGNYFFGKKDFMQAREYFERACAVRIDFPDAWFNLGNVFIELHRFGDACSAFEKALRYRREFPSALKNLGWVYEHEGRYTDAEKCYAEAILTNKADARLHVNLGNIQMRLRKYDEAKKSFLKAIRLAPNDLPGWMGLRGYALTKGDIGTFVRASLAVLPRLSDDVLAQSIAVLYDLHQVDKAHELLAQADRLGRSGDLLDLQRLLLYQRKGEHQQEIQAIAARISSVNEPSDGIHYGLARYHLCRKEYAAARERVERMLHPDDAAWGILWRAMLAQGKNVEVKRSVRVYLVQHPESHDPYFILARIEAQRGNLRRAETLLIHALDHGFNDMEEIYADSVLGVIFEKMTGKRLVEDA